jgi:UPF0716 family protein affecting phage T7 exclusion
MCDIPLFEKIILTINIIILVVASFSIGLGFGKVEGVKIVFKILDDLNSEKKSIIGENKNEHL